MQKLKNIYHLARAFVACVWFGFPSRKLKVIGVTGTDGKTTTTSLLYHILNQNNKKVSMISTIFANIGGQIYDTGLHTTTPDPWDIQKYLAKAYKNGSEYFILETTSHALDQNRVWGVQYEMAVITNVTHEHLDYHINYENYLNTKARLLYVAKKSIVNHDDSSYKKISEILTKKNIQYLTYGINNKSDFNWQRNTKTKLIGTINRYNILAAYSVAFQLGLKDGEIKNAVATFESPKGRMELVHDGEIKVIVDFAHTPNAIYNALATIRDEYINGGKGRLIHVFGSAGLRDVKKRPLMGEASGKLADMVILTEEDHRTENVETIIEQIGCGLSKLNFRFVMPQVLKENKEDKLFTSITDRLKAIVFAISIAKKNDVVVITGKSHEASLCRGKAECPWDEFAAVKRGIKMRK